MKIYPSQIEGVEIGPATDLPVLAKEFGVLIDNRTDQTIAFVGARFDLILENGRPAASMQYSDMLRYADQADFVAGGSRFVSIEHGVTESVRHGSVLENNPGYRRILMNLEGLRRMLGIGASLDCIAFADGRFFGPDLGGAYPRLCSERATELQFQLRILGLKTIPASALRDAPKRFAHLSTLLLEAGEDAVRESIEKHCFRIPLRIG